MPKELLIASPVYNGMFVTEYVESLFDLTRRLEGKGIPSMWHTATSADVAECRNYLLSTFYFHTRSTDLLFIDADTGYPAALISDMLALDKPVVGVIYPMRTMAKDGKLSFVAGRFLGPKFNGFSEVDACGSGILLISRQCVSTMIEKMPDIIAVDQTRFGRTFPKYIRAFDRIGELSEDISFCQRWRSCGGQIWANTRHPIRHVGQFAFTGSYDGQNAT